ncbi:MAG: selenocysteine-specific translation elongation factor [Thermaerobacter sp.]|nr:selenocysteine-specific translation elongation factor [Thermaerobacter sp.]
MEKMHPVIIGTAGHIDHGKTTLVKALTGQDADRLPEEKSRGITIDLGFAHMTLPSGQRLAFIDVPGHERFVRNMVAGVHGMDAVLLVVAADEGVMPQTSEHLAILRLLGVERGLTVMTKSDLVDSEMLEVVNALVDEAVAGTFLEGQSVVAVDAVSGHGLRELTDRLEELARHVRPRPQGGPVRLPIDRVFTVKGFGTVVTGTLVSGSIRLEDSLEVVPSHQSVRVRGLQVHNQSVDHASSGQRVAVNLAGVDRVDVKRGTVLASPGTLAGIDVAEVDLEILPQANTVADKTRVHVHAGTAEALGRIYLFEGTGIEPGTRGFAEIRLESPIPLERRDRILIRSYSPVVTIGGGIVLEAGVHHRKKEPELLQRFRRLASGDDEAALTDLVRDQRQPVEAAQAARQLNLGIDEIHSLAESTSELVTLGDGLVWGRARLESWIAEVRERIAAYMMRRPIKLGMPIDALKAEVASKWPLRVFRAALDASGVVLDREWVRLTGDLPEIGADDRAHVDAVYRTICDGGLKPPRFDELRAHLGLVPDRFDDIIERLYLERRLLRLEDGLALSREAFDGGRTTVEEAISRDGPKSTAELREALGINRRMTVLFLELLDRERVTRRVGDSRELVS